MTELTTLAWTLTRAALAFSLLVQTVEYLRLTSALTATGVNPPSLQATDWRHLPSPVAAMLSVLSRSRVWQAHLLLRLAALGLLVSNAPGASGWLLFLWFGQLLILWRWRGAFNGGSDFMTVCVLTGLTAGSVLNDVGVHSGPSLGLYYIALHSASSYFISGAIKCLHPEWRQGRALAIFLDEGVYGPLSPNHPFRTPWVAATVSVAFIAWELSVVIALAVPAYAVWFCGIGVLFHVGVFWTLGLNRFVWAWLSSYPALLYLSRELSAAFH